MWVSVTMGATSKLRNLLYVLFGDKAFSSQTSSPQLLGAARSAGSVQNRGEFRYSVWVGARSSLVGRSVRRTFLQ